MKWLVFALNRGFECLSGITTTQTLNKCLSRGLSEEHIAWAEKFKRVPWASKFHGLRIRRMRKVLKSVFPFSVFPFVRYKILLSFNYYTLFCFPSFIVFVFVFFCGKDNFLFLNAVERNFQSFNQSSAVQYYSIKLKRQSVKVFQTTKTASTFCVSQEGANSGTNGPEQNKWSFPLVWSRGRGAGGKSRWD